MIETCQIIEGTSHIITVFSTNYLGDPLIWNALLILFIVGGIIAGVVLFIYSKKPQDWKHEPKIEGRYSSGKLKGLAESIKLTPVDESDDSFLKKNIQRLFLEKIRQTHGLSAQEIIDLRKKNPQKLRKIINDEEIADWVLNIKKKKTNPSGFFSKDRISKKEMYLMDINSILDKMEAWGE